MLPRWRSWAFWSGARTNFAWCDNYYTEYHKKTFHGKKWYRAHVYYKLKTPDGNTHEWDTWYYCHYRKYDDPLHKRPAFKVSVTYKPTGNHYWEWFYYWKSPTR